MLLASAALGRWQTLPLPVGLVGIVLLFDAIGLLLHSYFIAGDTYRTDRWPDAIWITGLLAAFLAALVILAKVDRPVRLSREPLPGVSPKPLLVVTATASAASGGVVLQEFLSGEHPGLFADLAAIGWIGINARLSQASPEATGLPACRCCAASCQPPPAGSGQGSAATAPRLADRTGFAATSLTSDIRILARAHDEPIAMWGARARG